LWCHHIVFSNKIFGLVSDENKILVSIVRRPSLRFQSAWYWYEHGNHFSTVEHSANLNITLNEFVRQVSQGNYLYQEHLINFSTRFKYRTGLDATSVELVGESVNSPVFQQHFNELLAAVNSSKYFLFVSDRMDERSLKIFFRIILVYNLLCFIPYPSIYV